MQPAFTMIQTVMVLMRCMVCRKSAGEPSLPCSLSDCCCLFVAQILHTRHLRRHRPAQELMIIVHFDITESLRMQLHFVQRFRRCLSRPSSPSRSSRATCCTRSWPSFRRARHAATSTTSFKPRCARLRLHGCTQLECARVCEVCRIDRLAASRLARVHG